MTESSKVDAAPFISVVMPAYNAGSFIGEVIVTVLEQTFTDFEFIILDDGSTDNTAAVVKKYASIDSRIKYYYQENQGSENLGSTINTAVSYANAQWIARADADDPWYLDKLEKQIAFLENNPDHILIGGAADIINERGVFLYTLHGPMGDDDNKRALTLYTPLAHGSVIFKKSIFDELGGYRDIHAVEDLDLWQRMSRHGKMHNIPEPLFKYRKNTQGISLKNQEIQAKAVEKLGLDFFKVQPLKILSRTEFKNRLNAINELRGTPLLPEHTVDWMIVRLVDDNIRIARLHIKYGVKNDGLKQIIAIATSGRVGCKMVVRAIKDNVFFQMSHLWKK